MNEDKKSESPGLFGSALTKMHRVAHSLRGVGPKPEGCETDGDTVDLSRLKSKIFKFGDQRKAQ